MGTFAEMEGRETLDTAAEVRLLFAVGNHAKAVSSWRLLSLITPP